MTSERDRAALRPEQATIPPGHPWNRLPVIGAAAKKPRHHQYWIAHAALSATCTVAATDAEVPNLAVDQRRPNQGNVHC